MSFHGPIWTAGEPIEVYWTPADLVEETDASDPLMKALSQRADKHAFVFLQSGVFDVEDGAPMGYFDVAMNQMTGDVCGFFMRNPIFGPIWTAAMPGDHEAGIQQVHARLVEHGILAGPASE